MIKELVRLNTGVPLIAGIPGVGKTTTALAIGKDLGYTINYTNASMDRTKEFLIDIFTAIQRFSYDKQLFILDEVDALKNWGMLSKIIDSRKHSLILIGNDVYKAIPQKVREKCKLLDFKAPYLREVRPYVVKKGKDNHIVINKKKITRSVRNSLLAGEYESESRVEKGVFEIIRAVFTDQDVSGINLYNHSIWLLETICKNYRGRNLYYSLHVLDLSLKLGRKDLLKELSPVNNPIIAYPTFLRLRKGKNN